MNIQPVRLLSSLNLLAVCCLAALWFDSNGELRNVQWETPAPVAPQIEKLNVTMLPAASAPNPLLHMAILERPLFAPDRRPPPPPAPPAEPPPPDPMASVQLMGLFSGANGGVLARVEGKVRRIKLNESIGAWALKSVEGREATFIQGVDSRKVLLSYSRLGVPVPAPATPAAPVASGTAPAAPVAQNIQDEMRARLARRNEVRARAGLPPATE